jgi:hypothetical protein
MTQYFSHELKRWQHSNPVTLGERSAFQVVVKSNQVTAETLDKCANGKMNFCAPVLSDCLGSCQ